MHVAGWVSEHRSHQSQGALYTFTYIVSVTLGYIWTIGRPPSVMCTMNAQYLSATAHMDVIMPGSWRMGDGHTCGNGSSRWSIQVQSFAPVCRGVDVDHDGGDKARNSQTNTTACDNGVRHVMKGRCKPRNAQATGTWVRVDDDVQPIFQRT